MVISQENIEFLTEKALHLNAKDFAQDDLLKMLESSIVSEKMLGLLKLKNIHSKSEVSILLSLLFYPDSRVRELASEVIYDFVSDKNYSHFFETDAFYNKAVLAVCDINPNVCRNIISVFSCVQDKALVFAKISGITLDLIKKLESEPHYKKTHEYDKLTFQLFWNLKALQTLLFEFDIEVDVKIVLNILEQSSVHPEYTIREQSAYLISAMRICDESIANIKSKLKNDSNFYVRQAIC